MKTLNNKKLKLWNNWNYLIKDNEVIISKALIKSVINKFWIEFIDHLPTDQHVILLFRVRTAQNVIRTIGHLQKLNKDDKEFLIKYLNNILSIKQDEYKETIIQEIFISFGIRKGQVDKHEMLNKINVPYQFYRNYKIPVSFDPLSWGKLILQLSNKYIVQITPLTIASIDHNNNSNQVEIFKDGDLILQFEDTLTESGLTRTIGDKRYFYNREGKLELFKSNLTTRYIKKTAPSLKLNEKFITLDIETRVIDKIHVPYLICWHDGKISKSFYLNDYKSMEDMFQTCILSLCRRKYHRSKIYIHNLANFDGIFLLRQLVQACNNDTESVKPLINNGKIIQFGFEFKPKDTKYSINLDFRDSYQILLSSLSKLGKSFKTDTQKGIFPYDFVNTDVDLNYNGLLPERKYFNSSVTDLEYSNLSNQFKNQNWCLKSEAINYCINDCITLYQTIKKYNLLNFDLVKVNINDHPTVSSHSKRVFTTHHLEPNTIPMIYGEEYKNLKQSYTGGATDMFIPQNEPGELIYCYDVNSLYPYIMSTTPMPVGQKRYFEGDIRKYDKDAYGFFYCKIKTPDDLEHPILQTHCKTHSGIRTISPLGQWEDTLFSPEMDNAINKGYNFEVLRGNLFKKAIIFKEYIDDLYNLRLKYNKNDPMNFIAKILMNSLYGRFGMSDQFTNNQILTRDELTEYLKKGDNLDRIIEILHLDDSFLVQSVKDTINQIMNINIAIASSIPSNGRIYMSMLKNIPGLKLYYTDTDSIYCNLSPEEMNALIPGIVNKTELGKLKLEHICKRAIFASPKCYILETLEGEIISKVKGLTKKVSLTLSDFEALLQRDYIIQKTQTKWYKSLSEGTIKVLDQTYTLQQTHNKRKLIYDNSGRLIATSPYRIDETKIIK